MFKPQFAPAVESGTKAQTVRPTPKRMPRPGDLISLRTWTGRPYHSPQRILREEIISDVAPITINPYSLTIGAEYLGIDPLGYNARYDFARADGFSCWEEMRDWFETEHGLPFDGIVIFWSVKL
jgi:hypothetical protein